MSTTGYARRFVDHPLGRIAVLLGGIAIIYTGLALYPPFGTAIWWAFPALFFLTGVWELYRYGADSTLSVVAGVLLVLGGISRVLYQSVPMNEFAGTVANLIPLFGFFALMYARYYRENE